MRSYNGVITIFVVYTVITQARGLNYSCPNVVSREEWGADPPNSVKNLTEYPAPYVVIHHSETPQCVISDDCVEQIRSIQQLHMTVRHWADIGYNFLIGGDGKIYEGRGWGKQGAHHPTYNTRSLGICLIGTYQSVDPPFIQIAALNEFLHCAFVSKNISKDYKLIGHRQEKNTACPGDKLFEEVKKLQNWEPNPN